MGNGRSPSGQALVSDGAGQAVSTLTGFDPSRDQIALMLELDRLWRTPKMRREFEETAGFDPLFVGLREREQIDSGYYAEYQDAFRDWAEARAIDRAAREAIQAEADRLLCDDRDLGDALNGLLSDFDADALSRLALLIHQAVNNLAQAIDARRAETLQDGSVHESAVGNADAPKE